MLSKLLTYVGTAIIAICLLSPAPAMAQDTAEDGANGGWVVFPDDGLKAVGIGLGLGLVIMGGGRGIGNIGSSAVESMARQPEAAGSINGAMVLSAAFVEGATLFGVVVLLLAVFLI